jgi:2-keto-4-pentenoate hydratase/2-oxohepta-3-ene-1,7-dioic acid hydratase in catechol pathway
MRFATLRSDGGTRLHVEVGERLVEVASLVPDLVGIDDVAALLRAGPAVLDRIRDAGDGPGVGATSEVRWAPPITRPPKIICIGLNYRKHAIEGGAAIPDSPIIFSKFANSLAGSGEPVSDHHGVTSQLDYEAELAVVIGRKGRAVSREEASELVAGYTCANDLSARDLQHNLPGGQWVYGKTLDTFCPLGPFFVTADDVEDWRQIRMQTWVNGEERQNELCGDMIFGVEELVSYISRGITLEPGDVILTGTPSGVGLGFKPPKWLRAGDTVEIELTGLGRLVSRIVSG